MLGGHSIRNPEPVYGFAVTAMVSPRHVLTNAQARPGDVLVLDEADRHGHHHHGDQERLGSARARAKSYSNDDAGLNTAGPDVAEARIVKAGSG